MSEWMQERLFGGAAVRVSPDVPVFAIDFNRRSSGERVADLARLGYLPEPVLDPTWGLGNMWTVHQPDRLVRADTDPERGKDVRASAIALPFRDQAFASCLFDPPFKLTHDVRVGRDSIAVQYGAHANAHRVLAAGVAECARVTSRYLTVKVQDQTENWRLSWQTGDDVVATARRHGFDILDLLHQINSIPQPPGRPQRSARHNYTTYVVLVRMRKVAVQRRRKVRP